MTLRDFAPSVTPSACWGALVSVVVVVAGSACSSPVSSGSLACGQLDARDGEVVLCSELDQALVAQIAFPEGEPPAEGWPGIVVLHGSGGLYPGVDGLGCGLELHDQFALWRDELTAQGFALIMPASFRSRGFCAWDDRHDVVDNFTAHERLVVRTFDARAAAQWMCDDPRVDCDALAVLGFSNGASIALMTMHEDLTRLDDERLVSAGTHPYFKGAVAYYPGCGLQGEFASSLEEAEESSFYFPYAPVWVPHAEYDDLLGNCEALRDPQVEILSAQRGISDDLFGLTIFEDADHGFDLWTTSSSSSDHEAGLAAQPVAIGLFETWLD